MQGGTRVRVILIDEDDNEIGTADLPLTIESPQLDAAISELTDVIRELKFLAELQKG